MKKLGSISMFLLVVMLLTSAVSAQGGLSGSGWWSGEQVQNVGSSAATITITAYDKDSTTTFTENKSVDPGGAYTFTPFTEFSAMPDGFQGSAIVSANQPIKAIVNVTNLKIGSFGEDGGKAAAQYQGFDGNSVATTLFFPLVKGDYYEATTTFYVQNAGSEAATAQAVFTMRTGDVYTYTTPSIEPGRMVVFSVYDAKKSDGTAYTPPGASGDNGRVGSLKVTSAQNMAGVVLEHATAESPATYVQGTRAFVPSDYDTKAYAPVIKHDWYGRFTGIQVQNPSTTAISVTVTYQGAAGACKGNTYTDGPVSVPAGEAYTFVQYNTTTTNLPETCYGAATITGTGQFVALVNEGAYAGGAGITYSAMPDKTATTKVSAPLFKDNYYQSTSGLGIENVGTAEATNVVATFSCNTSDGTSFTAVSEPQTISAGGAFLFYRPSQDANLFESASPFSKDGANCSVVITSDQPIVAIVNEMGYGQVIDDNNYEGFNLTP